MNALPSITVMPLIEDGGDGWYVVIGGQRVAGPFTEGEASRQLERMLAQ
jgi:hypothetical protein